GQAWVQGMYNDLLGRSPDQGGLSYWVDRLNAGADPASVAYGFAGSAEREGQRISRDYWNFLGRAPESGAVNYWVGQFLGGASNENVVAGFVGSDEYFTKWGNGNSKDFLTVAYNDVLRRDVTPQDTAAWAAQLPGLASQTPTHNLSTA